MSSSRFYTGDSPTQRFLDALSEVNGQPIQQNGNGWKACCPAHDDRNPSLSIKTGDDGKVVVNCFAGCSTEAVCQALGMSLADLFPPRDFPRNTQPKPSKSKGLAYRSDDEAIKALERQLGDVDNFWEYHDAHGNVEAYVLRWDQADGKKTIRPVSLHSDGWRIGGMPEPRPLYRLPDLADAETVFVTEGEKAADAAGSIGLTATTSAHGSQSAGLTDWSPLAGKNVVILPDYDEPGRQYAETVCGLLSALSPAPTVKVIELPGLPDHGDIWDWLEERDAHQPDDLRASIEALAESTEVWKPQPNGRQPKPTDRTSIQVTADEHIVIAETLDALAHDPVLYHRDGELVHVVRQIDDKEEAGIERFAGTPRVMSVSSGYLRERMAALCYFHKLVKSDDTFDQRQCAPPGFAVNSIHTRGFWPTLRQLTGITEAPVLRPDGSILDSPGWDQATGLFFEPGGDVPQIPVNPSLDDAVRALNILMTLVADFPFAKITHRATWLAGLLTVLARRAFRGPAPLFLMDANVRGSGKSLLTDLIAIVTTGRNMPRFANPQNDEEARKRITALAISGDPLVLIDNIASTLGGLRLMRR